MSGFNSPTLVTTGSPNQALTHIHHQRHQGRRTPHLALTGHNITNNTSTVLNEILLRDLLSAGLNAAGFSERQRWELWAAAEYVQHHFRVSPLAQWWPFEVVGRKKGASEDVVEVG